MVIFCTYGVTEVLSLAPGLRPGLAVPLILPLLIAAMGEGRHYAQNAERRPPQSACWLVASSMFALWCATIALPGFVLLALFAELPQTTVLHLVLAISILPVLRIGYGLGVGSELKGLRQFAQ